MGNTTPAPQYEISARNIALKIRLAAKD